jgi:hypothetical protein
VTLAARIDGNMVTISEGQVRVKCKMGNYSIEYNEAVNKRLSMVLKSLLRSMEVNLLAAANNGVAFWDVIDANNE